MKLPSTPLNRRPCSCCVAEWADDMNAALISGVSTWALSVQYGVSESTVAKHQKEHLGTINTAEGLKYITIYDVANIPMQMKERAETIQAMLHRVLEVMDSKNWQKDIQAWLLVSLWTLQQRDEAMLLKITGTMQAAQGMNEDRLPAGDVVVSERYKKMAQLIDARLAELEDGNDDVAEARARQILAEAFMPQVFNPEGQPMEPLPPLQQFMEQPEKAAEEVSTTYVDLGSWQDDEGA